MSTDITVRCHSCARTLEVVAYPDEVRGGVYVIPRGKHVSCPWCGRVHDSGFEFRVEEAAA